MKQYNKPSINVVELSVKENIAALPAGFQNSANIIVNTNQTVALTTYNLTANAGDSSVAQG